MPSLWDLGNSSEEKLKDSWEEDGVLQEKLDKHRHKFEDKFEENMREEIPTHPYKIYRNMVAHRNLSDEEKIALEHIKDEFAEKWHKKRKEHSAVEEPAKSVFEAGKQEKIPDNDLHDLMNAIVEQIISTEAFIPYSNSPGEKKIEGKFNFVPDDNRIIAEKYFELLEKSQEK